MGIEISCVYDSFDDAERAFIQLRRTQNGIRLLGIGPSTRTGRRVPHSAGPAAAPVLSGGMTMVTGLYSPFAGDAAVDEDGGAHEPALRREVRLRVSAADDFAARRAVKYFVSTGARGIRRNDHASWS